jgi:cystathionine beta-lyase
MTALAESLDRITIAELPAFGEAGAGHVRLNFATPRPVLTDIVRQLGQAVANR